MTRRSPIYNHAAELSQRCREDYELYLEHYFERAEAACRGRMVNRRGMARGVTGSELLRGAGHHKKRAAYASEELQQFVERDPVRTRTEFERQWLDAHIGAPSRVMAVA